MPAGGARHKNEEDLSAGRRLPSGDGRLLAQNRRFPAVDGGRRSRMLGLFQFVRTTSVPSPLKIADAAAYPFFILIVADADHLTLTETGKVNGLRGPGISVCPEIHHPQL